MKAHDGLPLREYELPFRAQTVSIQLPADPLALVSDDPQDAAQEIYWAELWPSALALSEMLLHGEIDLPAEADDRVLDLGCGSGLAAIAAALQGARVVAGDCEPRALDLTRLNATRNGVSDRIETVQLDWRKPYGRRHPLVLAADCLYEPAAGAHVARFLNEALVPGGLAVVADPERWSARHFRWTAQKAGFEVRDGLRDVPFIKEQGPVRSTGLDAVTAQQVRVYTLRRRPDESLLT